MKAEKMFIQAIAVGVITTFSISAFAGNKDRIGEAGATELTINPWPSTAGLWGANSASARGLEAVHLNVAGLASVQRTDVLFANSTWLQGSEVFINAFGVAQKFGESNVIGLNVVAMSFGDIEVTTMNNPEGGLGTFSPTYLTIGASFAKAFSRSIHAGATLKIISESISNVDATGVAFDAGVRYTTGKKDHIKFGIALKNVGPKMKFGGDGLSYKAQVNGEELTLEQRSQGFELPSQLIIGLAYDFHIAPKVDSTGKVIKSNHILTAAANFTANSFGKDQVKIGLEYGFRSIVYVRVGYAMEDGTYPWDDGSTRTTVYTGLAAGLGFSYPLGKGGTRIGVDYAYAMSNPFGGTHTVGVRINI